MDDALTAEDIEAGEALFRRPWRFLWESEPKTAI